MPIKGYNVKYIYNPKEPARCTALNDVSFEIEEKDFLCVVGKTGSGKSTLVQTLNALILPTDGYVQVDDFYVTENKKLKKNLLKDKSKEIKKNNKRYALLRKKIGLVFQFPEYQLFSMSVLDDVMFGPINFGLSKEEAKEVAKKALNDVGINASYYQKSPFELSGGEKRRVAIAGILASNPDVLVLDEPTAGLDSKGKEMIMGLLNKLHDSGKIIIVITHDMNIVMNYAKKVFVMSDGKLIKVSTPHELFSEIDLADLSLEEPVFYKFKKLLKYGGFAGNLDKISEFNELIEEIYRGYKHGK